MRGGPGNEGRLTIDGLSLGASLNGTGVSYTVADVGNAQEVVFTTAGGLGESEVGGPSMNLVPRQGGNRFSGSFFGNWANDSLQTQQLHGCDQGVGAARAEPDDEDLGHQRLRRRSDSQRQAVVLHRRSLSGQSEAGGGDVRQRERRRRQRLDLRAASGRRRPTMARGRTSTGG